MNVTYADSAFSRSVCAFSLSTANVGDIGLDIVKPGCTEHTLVRQDLAFLESRTAVGIKFC